MGGIQRSNVRSLEDGKFVMDVVVLVVNILTEDRHNGRTANGYGRDLLTRGVCKNRYACSMEYK